MDNRTGYAPKAGENVFAMVGGDEIGPAYLVQITGELATLQLGEALVVKVSDITRPA